MFFNYFFAYVLFWYDGIILRSQTLLFFSYFVKLKFYCILALMFPTFWTNYIISLFYCILAFMAHEEGLTKDMEKAFFFIWSNSWKLTTTYSINILLGSCIHVRRISDVAHIVISLLFYVYYFICCMLMCRVSMTVSMCLRWLSSTWKVNMHRQPVKLWYEDHSGISMSNSLKHL